MGPFCIQTPSVHVGSASRDTVQGLADTDRNQQWPRQIKIGSDVQSTAIFLFEFKLESILHVTTTLSVGRFPLDAIPGQKATAFGIN